MKKLNWLLAASMIAGTITLPAVHAESSVVLADDFELASTIGNYTIWGGSGQYMAGCLNLDSNDTWGTMVLTNDQNGWTEGEINASFKIKVNSGVGLFSLRNDTTETGCELLKFDGDKIVVMDEAIADFSAGKWYSAEVKANLTSGEFSVKVMDGENVVAEKNGTSDTVKDWTADRPLFQGWGGIAQVDNVEVSYTSNGISVDVWKDNFDNAATIGNYTIWGGSGKYLAGVLNLDATDTWGTMILPNDQHAWTEGVINASFDVKVSSGVGVFSLRNDTTETGYEVLKLEDGKILLLNEEIGAFANDTWYHADVKANLTSGDCKVVLKDGETVVAEKLAASDDIKNWTTDRPLFQNWGGLTQVDNVYITYSDTDDQPIETTTPPLTTTEPAVTEPAVTEPAVTEPAVTEPVTTPSAGIEWTDDFDSYASAADLSANYSIPDWSNAGGAAIIENGDGKALQLNPSMGTQTNLIRDLNSATGKIGVDVDIIPVDGPDNKIVFSDNAWGNETLICVGNSAHIVENGNWTKIGNTTPGKTYTVRTIVDTAAHTIDVAIIDENGYVSRASAPYNGENVGFVQLAQGAWAAEGGVVYDNWKITASPAELPQPYQPTEDPNKQNVLWEDDFESYNSISDAAAKYGVWPDMRNSAIIEDNGSKVIKLQPEASASDWQLATTQFYKQLDKTYTSGKLGFTYQFKPAENGNMNFIIKETGGFEAMVPRAAGSSLYIGTDADCWNNNFGMVSAEQWYDAAVVLDLDSDVVTIDITDKNGNVRRGTYSYTGNFDTFAMGVYSDTGSAASFDNIKVVTNPDPLPELKELPFRDDFESYNDIVDSGANWSLWAPETNMNPSKLVNTDKGKSYYFGLSQGVDSTSAKKSFVDPIASGRIKVSFDIQPGANVGTHVKFDTTGTGEDSSFLPVFYFQNGEVGTVYNWIDQNTKIGTYRDSEWLHCVAVIDIDNGTITAEVEDPSGSIMSQSANYEQMRENEISTLTGFTFQEWGATADIVGSIFDNVCIEYDTSVPVLTANKVSFKLGDSETKGVENVPAAADKVLLNFGTAMDLQSCRGITVKEAETGKEISYTLSNDGSKVALVLAGTLKPLTQYNLYVPATAANITGDVMGADFNISFTTGEGELIGEIESVESGGNTVSRLTQLKANSELNITYNAANATAAACEPVLIVVYYSNNEVKSVEYEKTTLNAEERASKVYKHTVKSLDDVTQINIMLWDGFDNILPLVQSYQIK